VYLFSSGKIEDATPVLNTHQPEAQSTTFEQVNLVLFNLIQDVLVYCL